MRTCRWPGNTPDTSQTARPWSSLNAWAGRTSRNGARKRSLAGCLARKPAGQRIGLAAAAARHVCRYGGNLRLPRLYRITPGIARSFRALGIRGREGRVRANSWRSQPPACPPPARTPRPWRARPLPAHPAWPLPARPARPLPAHAGYCLPFTPRTSATARPGPATAPGPAAQGHGVDIPIKLIGIVDIGPGGCHALCMTAHPAVRRRHVDLLRVASALCRGAAATAGHLAR